MKKLLVIVFLILTLVSNAQSPNFNWAGALGSPSVNSIGWSIDTDAAGNVYSVGNFAGVSDFNPSAITNTLSAIGSQDFYISKLDPSGNFLWAKQFGGTQAICFVNSVYVDVLGNSHITGSFRDTIDLDPGIATFTIASIGSFNSSFIVKLDPNGNFVWGMNFSGASLGDYGQSVSGDGTGNIYITGGFDGTLDFDPSVSSYTLSASSGADMYILKLDASGNFVWVKQISAVTFAAPYPKSISLDGFGNILTTGYFGGIIDFDPSLSTYTLSATSNAAFVLKLDPAGNFLWAKKIGGNTQTIGYDIKADATGNIISAGAFSGLTDFDPDVNVYNLLSGGSDDIYISKLDGFGNFIWAVRIGNSGVENAFSLDIDQYGSIYSTGVFEYTVDFNPGSGIYNLNGGFYDIFISKLDAGGNFVWAVGIGDAQADVGRDIKVDSFNSVYTTGNFKLNPDFDPGTSVFTLTTTGGDDAFVHKMNQCLTPLPPSNITPTVNQNICVNNSTSLSVTATGTVSWYASSTSTTVLSTGTTYITPTLTVGTYTYYAEAMICNPSPTRTAITVTVSPFPTVSATSTSSLLCFGQTATLSAIGASTYTWNTSATTNTIAISPTITTTYTVIGMSSNCRDTTTFIQNVSTCAGINEFNSDTNVFLYPNPNNGSFKLQLNTEIENTELILLNLIGQKVFSQKLKLAVNEIKTQGLAKGLYHFSILHNKTQIQTGKIVIE